MKARVTSPVVLTYEERREPCETCNRFARTGVMVVYVTATSLSKYQCAHCWDASVRDAPELIAMLDHYFRRFDPPSTVPDLPNFADIVRAKRIETNL